MQSWPGRAGSRDPVVKETTDEVCLVSAELLAVAAARGVPLLDGGARTVPLTGGQMGDLGVVGLPARWPPERRGGRQIVYVICRDRQGLDDGREYHEVPRPKG